MLKEGINANIIVVEKIEAPNPSGLTQKLNNRLKEMVHIKIHNIIYQQDKTSVAMLIYNRLLN